MSDQKKLDKLAKMGQMCVEHNLPHLRKTHSIMVKNPCGGKWFACGDIFEIKIMIDNKKRS